MARYCSLPHEGLTLEALFAPIKYTLLEPLFTSLCLLGIIYQPVPLKPLLSPVLYTLITSPKTIKGLGLLIGVGTLRKVNAYLSRRFANNFTFDKWQYGDEIVLISGGSGGIGELLALRMAPHSKAVVVLDLAPSSTALPPNVFFYKCDVTKSEEIASVAEKIRKLHGSPTVLVNNAGVAMAKVILDESESEYRKTFEVNIISQFTMVKEFLPAMVEKNHGHVVTVASVASFLSFPRIVDYACTKAATLAFHEGLSFELLANYKADKVRTTIIHPLWVRTPIIQMLLDDKNFKQFILEPETVVDSLQQNLLNAQGGQIILPARFTLIPLMRVIPTWLQMVLKKQY